MNWAGREGGLVISHLVIRFQSQTSTVYNWVVDSGLEPSRCNSIRTPSNTDFSFLWIHHILVCHNCQRADRTNTCVTSYVVWVWREWDHRKLSKLWLSVSISTTELKSQSRQSEMSEHQEWTRTMSLKNNTVLIKQSHEGITHCVDGNTHINIIVSSSALRPGGC